MFTVATIIVNYNTPRLTLNACNSALQIPSNYVLIVDNSNCFSCPSLLSQVPKNALVLKTSHNVGFGNAVNIGLRYLSRFQDLIHILLLNSDATIIPENIKELIQTSKVNSISTGYSITSYGDSIPLASRLSQNKLFGAPIKTCNDLQNRLSWISGACMLINFTNLNQIYFSSKYFMYWEDAEFCLRLKSSCGYVLQIVSFPVCLHDAGASSRNIHAKRYIWHLKGHLMYLLDSHELNLLLAIVIFFRYSLAFILRFLKSLPGPNPCY